VRRIFITMAVFRRKKHLALFLGSLIAFVIVFVIMLLLVASVLVVSTPFLLIKKMVKVKRSIKPRIIRGPVPIISIKYNSEAERLDGYKSDTIVYSVYHINQKGDFDYVLSLSFHNPFSLFIPYITFIWVIWNYDVFQFFFNGGFLARTPLKKLELPLLKFLGKKIVVCPYGSDVHLPSKIKSKYGFADTFVKDGYQVDENKVHKNIAYFSKYADYIITFATLADSMPRWDSAFHYIPIELEEWQPVYCRGGSGKVRIVHAPNHRALKGTQYLIDACELLKREGYQIELVIVERKANIEARKIYESADIIAAQFIGGGPGLFEIEAMALGKPVLCYLREDFFKYHKSWAEIPIVNTNPDNLKENLVKLIENPELRLELGKKGRAFVEKYHSYEYIGGIFDKIYRKLWFGEDVTIDV